MKSTLTLLLTKSLRNYGRMHKRSRVTRSKESVVTRFEAKHFFLQLCRGKKMALNIEGAMSAVPRRYFFFFFST